MSADDLGDRAEPLVTIDLIDEAGNVVETRLADVTIDPRTAEPVVAIRPGDLPPGWSFRVDLDLAIPEEP